MKKYSLLPLCAMAAVALLTACSDSDEPGTSNEYVPIDLSMDEMAVVNKSNDFAFKLFAASAAENGNTLISPMSATIDLAMLANGAQGETLDEIVGALRLDADNIADINSYLATIVDRFTTIDKNTTFCSANSLWYADDIEIRADFVSTLNGSFSPDLRSIVPATFNADLNKWCSDKTNGLIKDFRNDGDTPQVMLANALYFEGRWSSPFDAKKTAKENFTTADGSHANVPFMKQSETHSFYGCNDFQMVTIDYGNGAFALSVILPTEGASLADFVPSFDAAIFRQALANSSHPLVNLELPKFEIKASSQMNTALKSLGIEKAFSPIEADFSAMSNTSLFVTKINQDCYIKIDESGTKAAAVTGAEMVVTSPTPPSFVDMKVDRPFIYVLHEKSTGTILFIGKIEKL